MANRDNAHGFHPLMRNEGGGHSQVREFTKDAAEGTAIFKNDLVTRDGDADISPGGTPGTTRYLGVALNFGAASTLTTHSVVISPHALFEAQDNDDTDGIAKVDLNELADAEFNAGNADTNYSGHEIDESSVATTATLDLRLIALYASPDNAHGSFARIEVTINKHLSNKEVAGV